jgi:HEAT repeat protein
MVDALSLVLALALVQTPSLESANPRERENAIRAIATLGNRDAVPLLLDAYKKESSSSIRRQIVEGLGRVRDAAALPALREVLLTDYETSVRLEAVDAFLQLYIPPADAGGFFDRVQSIFSADERPVVSPSVRVDPAAGEALALALATDFDAGVRMEAAYALGSLRMGVQLPVLMEAAEGPWNRESRRVRIAAIQAIGAIGGQEGGPLLARLLRDEDNSVVEESIRSIGRVGYRDAFPALSNLYQANSDRSLGELALEAMAMMRFPEARSTFESGLDSRDDVIRQISAEGLARIDSPPALFSERIIAERDGEVVLALAFALVASDQHQYLGQLIEALDTRRYQQAETYLFELGRYEGKLDLLFPHLRNPDTDIRARLLGVMGRIGSPESRPYVQPLTQDPNTRVMEAAVEAMRRLNQ